MISPCVRNREGRGVTIGGCEASRRWRTRYQRQGAERGRSWSARLPVIVRCVRWASSKCEAFVRVEDPVLHRSVRVSVGRAVCRRRMAEHQHLQLRRATGPREQRISATRFRTTRYRSDHSNDGPSLNQRRERRTPPTPDDTEPGAGDEFCELRRAQRSRLSGLGSLANTARSASGSSQAAARP